MSRRFENSELRYKMHLKTTLSILWDFMKNRSKRAVPKNKQDIPIISVNKESLEKLEDYSVIRLGHSTLLFKLENEFYLTDPVFSLRASPFKCMGPKRFHETPIDIDELPPIKAVIISHDHYDHLDKQSIKLLKDKVETFYTTLGVGKHLIYFGVESEKIVELDWWQGIKKSKIEFIATPAQHFSGRTLLDRDKTLWSSWVIKAPKAKLFFGADSGYFEGFKEIGFNHGPFDMTFLEAGAYNEKWKEIHMMPHETVQAHLDLKGKQLFPIHNGTFDLALHAWDEPFDKIAAQSVQKDIEVNFPKMGEPISLIKRNSTSYWWK